MMRKGIRNFCNGDGSTSTLNQEKEKPLSTTTTTTTTMVVVSTDDDEEEEDSDEEEEELFMSRSNKKAAATLEEMILQLEMEEQIASSRKSIRNSNSNSDILTSARNQYPRFSLDGKDALYRSSFNHPTTTTTTTVPARHSVCCDGRERLLMSSTHKKKLDDVKLGMPARLAGESVVWCNPGVIGKLMGLDAMPIPINNTKQTLLNSIHRINTSSFQRHHPHPHKLDHTSAAGRPINNATTIRRTPLFFSNMNRNCINTR